LKILLKKSLSKKDNIPCFIRARKTIWQLFLENIILLAESNEYYPDLNSKINDGLGMLLKIMAKYGA
jgi:hypothetical protein